MPFNDEKMRQPITRLEIADLSLSIMSALQATRWALEASRQQRDPSEDIENLASEIESFTRKWEEFTGWRPSNGG